MKPKKIFRVTVSKEVWLIADSSQEAEVDALYCADDDPASWNAFAVEVKSKNNIPDKKQNAPIWGAEDEVTVVEVADKILGPKATLKSRYC